MAEEVKHPPCKIVELRSRLASTIAGRQTQYVTHQNLKWYISHFTLKSPQNCSTYDGSKVQFTPIILAGGLRLFA